ncbi:WD repeat-containing protein 17 [Strongylocentrotus purpuratus]|uniref:WD repeat-containing protein 17 n=1 Tax=Strongylocentrotus purpuratus TaxID=7668 RepID=A0A7M7SWS8_STRPU|nr:WD repeat-containing protein 17 [Strongylocentrotus purpuratus]
MRQTSLLAAGCQPWNRDVCAASGDRFAYCATLAVYIYQLDRVYNEFKLHSIVAEHRKTITALAWHPKNSDLFATSGTDNRIIVWHVSEQRIAYSLEGTRATPTSLSWSMVDDNILSFCSGRGPLLVWNMQHANSITPHKEAANFGSEVTLVRLHHKQIGKLVTGHLNGSLSFFTVGKKCSKHVLQPESEDEDEDDPVVALEWDPLSDDYLLVINEQGDMRMIDSVSINVIMTFILPSTASSVRTMAWVPTAPGMFVSGDAHQGVLRLWNVSKPTPILSLKLKSTGFHSLCVFNASPHGTGDYDSSSSSPSHTGNHVSSTSQAVAPRRTNDHHNSYALPPGHAVCTFDDGGVGLYDLGKKRWDFLRELGHVETIFDCKFKPDNPDLLATASFDGTIKVWNINSWTAVDSSPGNEGIIYSISWAPADLNCLMAGTSRNGAFIWDITKGKIIKRYTEHGRTSIYSVAWCHKDSRRVASCGADNYCIVREIDGKMLQRYKHPSAVFGCDWSPNNKDMIATGCGDGKVRVYYIATANDQPLKTFPGHTAKVFHVRWSPLRDGILCSGSDDGTIRIWDYTQDSCVNILVGHGAHVRGLMWNPEIPYLLISGSWDYTIRVWDTRDGACVDKVLDHGADVYGLAMHPNRPFVLASCSRDSTVRIWSLTSLVMSSQMRIIAKRPWQEIITTTDHAMAVNTSTLMSGKVSRDLKSRIDHYRGNVDVETILRWFSNLFASPGGTANLWELVSVVNGQDDSLLPEEYSKGIMHRKHLIKFRSSDAMELELAKLGGRGAQSSRLREEKVREAARLHMKLGEVQRYCELMVELGEWEKALAVAPGISMEYWKQLAERYAENLSADENLDCVPYYLITQNIRKLVQFYCHRGQLNDALLVAQVASEDPVTIETGRGVVNGRAAVHEEGQRVNGLQDEEEGESNKLLLSVTELTANKFFHNGSPVLAACCHLAAGQTRLALSKLIRGHELELVISIGKSLKGEKNSSLVTMAIEMLSRRCEGQGNWDLAYNLIEDIPSNHDLKVKLCARCIGSAAEINHIHEKAGFPPLEDCREKAQSMVDTGNVRECVCYYLLSSTPEVAMSVGLPEIRSKLNQSDWVVGDVYDLLQLMGCIRTDRIMMQSVAQQRCELVILSCYVGALVAIRRGYQSIVAPLFSLAWRLIKEGSFGEELPLTDALVQAELAAWNAVSGNNKGPEQPKCAPPTPLQEDIYHNLIRRGESLTFDLEAGHDFVTGSHLPSHSDVHHSLLTANRIQGPTFFLDDGKSVISLNSALMWAKVCMFSPIGSGTPINPF